MPSTTENKEIARRFVEECWNQGKVDMVGELVANNCRFHDPVFPNLTSGAENLKQHISTCRNGFPDLVFSIDDSIAERNEVVLHWTSRGTHKAQFLGLAPTNRRATVSGTSIFRIENGKIAEEWSDWNLLTLMEQLGVSLAPKTQSTGESKTQSGESKTHSK
jgi:steroid delta-isomerase-like uncharacterized protein